MTRAADGTWSWTFFLFERLDRAIAFNNPAFTGIS
jgi:hypothetical protein